MKIRTRTETQGGTKNKQQQQHKPAIKHEVVAGHARQPEVAVDPVQS
jgi:hypothetical protein